MARADLLCELIKSGLIKDDTSFRKAAEAICAEERAKQHEILANKISEDILSYPVKDESFMEVFNNIMKKCEIFDYKEKNKILVKVIHNISVLGYDIDCIKPLSFKSYLD